MAYQPSGPISALGAFGPRADMGPLGLICHAIWILACIILYISALSSFINNRSAAQPQITALQLHNNFSFIKFLQK